MTVRCLSVHTRYACRHAGACCTAGWPIPIEADRFDTLRDAVANRRVMPPRPAGALWMTPADAPAETPARLESDADGCVFFDATAGRTCRIHRVLGHEALPLACRQFPRMSVIDPRGTSVTLSHFCPTAASLLEGHERLTIETTAPAFPAGTELSGLDVGASLPPLLRPGVLMDWDAWWAWEAQAVECLGRTDAPPADGLALVAAAVERVRDWTPGEGRLIDRVSRAFDGPALPGARVAPAREAWLADVLAAIPDDLRPADLTTSNRPTDVVVRHFLAAHAFANWTAHLGQGLRSWLRSIETAWALIDLGLGVGEADRLLRHLADPHALAAAFSQAERTDPRRQVSRPI